MVLPDQSILNNKPHPTTNHPPPDGPNRRKQKNAPELPFSATPGRLGCVPGRIRTPGLLIRSQTLYPAELRAHNPVQTLTRALCSRRADPPPGATTCGNAKKRLRKGGLGKENRKREMQAWDCRMSRNGVKMVWKWYKKGIEMDQNPLPFIPPTGRHPPVSESKNGLPDRGPVRWPGRAG